MSGILGDFLLVGGRFFYYADLNIFYCIVSHNSIPVTMDVHYSLSLCRKSRIARCMALLSGRYI